MEKRHRAEASAKVDFVVSEPSLDTGSLDALTPAALATTLNENLATESPLWRSDSTARDLAFFKHILANDICQNFAKLLRARSRLYRSRFLLKQVSSFVNLFTVTMFDKV